VGKIWFSMNSKMNWALAICLAAGTDLMAGSITISGLITQSVPESFTGPAVNNMALNDIHMGSAYTLTLSFAGSVGAPGNYTGTALLFSLPSAPATESSFGSITLIVSNSGATDTITLLGCLTTGSGCLVGNQLSAIFQISGASLNGQNVPATGLDPPHPLDLLEDDGVTDIQASITAYSYQGPQSTTPEPSSVALVGGAFGILWAVRRSVKKEERS